MKKVSSRVRPTASPSGDAAGTRAAPRTTRAVRAEANVEPDAPAARRIRRTPVEAKAHILGVAKKLLAELGPDATGLKLVAKHAGVSHALVSHYFGTYDALVEEALHAHMVDTRSEILARIAAMATSTGGLSGGPEDWIQASFDQFTSAMTGRLLAWSILSGRLESEDFFPRRDQGMRRVADAIEMKLQLELGEAAPSREDIEFAMLVNFSTGLGYSVARQVLWGSFAKEATPERDAWFRKRFAEWVVTSHPKVRALAAKAKK